jgi:hypothetical protein
MVLNALAIDPRRTWKGAWRWFHEQVCMSASVCGKGRVHFCPLSVLLP